jgi:thymidine phosphorylase
LIAAQGGNLAAFNDLRAAPVIREWRADRSGMLTKLDAGTVGRAAAALGAGRTAADDAVNHAVGFDQIIKTGTSVRRGDVLLRVHAATDESAAAALAQVAAGITIAS